jgi:hypothetical protein
MTTPWLSMWFRPRQTVRRLVESNPRKGFFCLSWIYGFPAVLRIFQEISLGVSLGSSWIILLAVVLALPVGWIILQYMTAIIFLLGKVIRGGATYIDVRVAVSWATIVNLAPVAMWIILISVFRQHLFFLEFTDQLFTGPEFGVMVAMFVTLFVAWVWWLIIFLHSLSEVQGFSFWMALLNLVLAGIIFTLIGLGVGSVINYFLLN